MKTSTSSRIAAIIVAAMISGTVHAHGDQTSGTGAAPQSGNGTWVYDNSGYSRGIHGYANAAPRPTTPGVEVIYVDKADGPAIYSYGAHEIEAAPDADRS